MSDHLLTEPEPDGMERPIIVYGHETLRLVARPVAEIDDDTRQLVASLQATVRSAQGIGLAAPQIDRSVRVCIVDPRSSDETARSLTLINPRIIEYAGFDTYEEGCLSIPGIYAEVRRPAVALVRYLDIDGKEHEEEFDGMMARVIQHETDHLNGKLFVDHLSRMRRALLGKKLREIKARQT